MPTRRKPAPADGSEPNALQPTEHRTLAELRERVKELTCLYRITEIAERPGVLLDDILRGVLDLLPPAWQYPDAAVARIELDGRSLATSGFQEGLDTLSTDVVVSQRTRGRIQVAYLDARPPADEGPFLREERHLLDAVARQLASIVERVRLREQLVHAERLATIGQLAAGVAHEVNEPLGTILGFAQLAAKSAGLPDEARRDLAKIEGAALHARGIIRQLLLFARQAPSRRTRVNLNQVVDSGLALLADRCDRFSITVVRSLSPEVPDILADPVLLQQVVVNLAVNAIQAMPDGGELAVSTHATATDLFLVIQDGGIGMDEETQRQVFLPFFTTKDVGEGTGLGLPVVHGIVTAHGGAIRIDSRRGGGATVEVRLPLNGAAPSQEPRCDPGA
jgi:two-component system NtrC family sensor kinase